jgi:hypothetical protein
MVQMERNVQRLLTQERDLNRKNVQEVEIPASALANRSNQ